MRQPSTLVIISLLGALSVISPLSIDMYLTAFHHVATDFSVETAAISLTLSSYFIGLSLGQIFYGPLLDRYGRKKPLYYGLGLFILASLGCALAGSITILIAFRFLQALGGCVAGIASVAMVRDLFPADQCAKILSRLFLFIAVSPLVAPSLGALVVAVFGWRAVFIVMGVITGLILLLIHFKLPESHPADPTISLKPLPIVKEYLAILKHPRFATYSLAGAFSFAGLFTFVAGSPIIFMEGFQLSARAYSMVFAVLAGGFISGSQINVVLLKKYSSGTLFGALLIAQVVISLIFVIGAAQGWYGFYATLMLFFGLLGCTGMSYPNAAALALTPFTKNAGSAAALLGFFQLGVGSVISSAISLFAMRDSFPIIAILAATSSIGLGIWLLGHKGAMASAITE